MRVNIIVSYVHRTLTHDVIQPAQKQACFRYPFFSYFMAPLNQSKTFKDVTCPFCSLLCDDIVLNNQSGGLTIRQNGCPKAVRGFQRQDPHIQPTIHGKESTLDEAIAHAAEILGKARQPIITGLGTDVSGSRAAMSLAEITGAIVDHSHGDAAVKNIMVLQTSGWMLTTLSELKNRADMIIFIGTDGHSNYPRFYDRFVWQQDSLSGLKKNAREIVYIGNKLKTLKGISPDGKKPTVVKCTDESLGETVSVIRALLNGNDITSKSISNRKLSDLKKLSGRIKHASYPVFVWAAGELIPAHSELTIHSICELVKELNKSSRAAGLSLAGSNGGVSFLNVCTWQSGYPLRVNYTAGYPHYDPYNYATTEVLGKTEADAMLWVSSFEADFIPPQTSIPTVVLSRPSIKNALDAEVYIPVGTPGLDHTGNLFRTDNAVNLPLKQVRQTGYQSVSDILSRIQDRL